MERRADLSTILVNLALHQLPPVLEDEERHPGYIRRFGRSLAETIQPSGWLYLAEHHPWVLRRFQRAEVDRQLRPLRVRFETDCDRLVPL